MSSSRIAFRRGTVPVVTLLCLAFLTLSGEIAYSQGAAQGTVTVFPFANISGQPEDEGAAQGTVTVFPFANISGQPEDEGAAQGTVAVFPFANISGQPEDDWLGAGIAETVATDFEGLSGLSVVGREAFLGSLGADGPDAALALSDEVARDLARELDVAWIVAGGFQRLGDQLRITARILSVETGRAHASATVDGNLDEFFALQDRVVAELSAGFAEIAGRGAPSVAAADARPGPSRRSRPAEGEGPADSPGAPDGQGNGGAFSAVPSFTPSTGSGDGANDSGRSRRPPAAAVTGGITVGEEPPQFREASAAGNAGALAGRVTVRPVRTRTPPDVDGRLDDAVWRDAARITGFVQQRPLDGAPATEDTDVYLAYDNSNIYLAVHAKYQDPGIMRANRVDRDRAGFSDDTISVYFDTFLDQQRAYVFSVNGYGVQGDSIVASRGGGGGFGGGRSGGGGSRGGVPRGDRSWDALYSTGGQLVEDGFTVEMSIPFKSLRYPQRGNDLPHTWGFQIVREIRGKDETLVWSPISRDIAGFLPQMGVLDGMTELSTSRNLEIQPTFTAFRFGSFDADVGKAVDGKPRPEGGANFKYGVTSNLIADFTLNPDFSQIESDRPQVEVNQRFALFFPELRPFFLEGAEIFQIQAPVTVVHTRTIVDPLYGAKLTGKAGKTTLGVLYTNDEGASLGIDDPFNPAFDQSAQTFVGRVRYDLYSESFIGAIFTDREFLDGYSRLAGLDSNFRVGDTHQLGFRALGTQHLGDDTLQSDGYLMDFGFRKRGRNLSYSIDAFSLSPDFKTDIGFVRRTDMQRYDTSIQYQWWPESWVLSWGPQVRYGQNYNFDQVLEDENLSAGLSGNFAKNIRANLTANRDMERFEGINFTKQTYRLFGNVNTSRRIGFGGGFNWGDQIYFDRANPFLGRETAMRVFIGFRPVSRFQSQINISTSRFSDPGGFFVHGINDGERDENGQIFDVKIFRALSTYQFTDRLLFRNITEVNTYDETLGLNFLFTYRVNSGTAFYIGYDDHYLQREQFEIEDQVNITGTGYQQTNRAVFTKIQYLFRY